MNYFFIGISLPFLTSAVFVVYLQNSKINKLRNKVFALNDMLVHSNKDLSLLRVRLHYCYMRNLEKDLDLLSLENQLKDAKQEVHSFSSASL